MNRGAGSWLWRARGLRDWQATLTSQSGPSALLSGPPGGPPVPGAGAAFLPSTLGILTHPKVWEETLWACVVWVGGAWTPASPISAGRFGGPPSQREAWAAVPPWAMREQVARRGQKARPLSTQVPGNTWEAGISRGGGRGVAGVGDRCGNSPASGPPCLPVG